MLGVDAEVKPNIVTYITRVGIKLDDPDCFLPLKENPGFIQPDVVREVGARLAAKAERAAQMMEFLGAKGFVFSFNGRSIYCYSDSVEAQDIKKYLLAEGFVDKEFQIVLEYTRGWGML